MVWTCSENGRGETTKKSDEMDGAHQEDENEVDRKLPGQKGLED
jgi:hypothetical protein